MLVTGVWSKAVVEEASKLCKVNIVEDTSTNGYTNVNEASWNVSPNADFFHYIENETADGFEYNDFPFEKVPADQPIVCDMSSSFMTRPIDWSKFGAVYAGAQKQVGVANTNILVVRKDLLGRHSAETPRLLAWQTFEDAPDTYPNTPNVWGVYMCGLMLDHQMT